MSLFLITWAVVTGTAAVGTFVLSAATYVRVRWQGTSGTDLSDVRW